MHIIEVEGKRKSVYKLNFSYDNVRNIGAFSNEIKLKELEDFESRMYDYIVASIKKDGLDVNDFIIDYMTQEEYDNEAVDTVEKQKYKIGE